VLEKAEEKQCMVHMRSKRRRARNGNILRREGLLKTVSGVRYLNTYKSLGRPQKNDAE